MLIHERPLHPQGDPPELDAPRGLGGCRSGRRRLGVGILGVALLALVGCSTLASYGIGGPPEIVCRNGLAWIDDRIVGSDGVRLSAMRRFADGDRLCKSEGKP